MTSILETIRHYQRSIDRSVEDKARLLHCLDKLDKLPINMKYLRETKVGRTVNNLRNHDETVGHAATKLIVKWKRAVEAESAKSVDKYERLHLDDIHNIDPDNRNSHTDSHENDISSTLNSDSRDKTENLLVSCSTRNNISESTCSIQISKNCDGERSFELCPNSGSTSRIRTERDSYREKTKNAKRKDCGTSDVIDIDHTMGTSFAEALGMLNVPSTSRAKKGAVNKSSSSKASTASSKHKKIGDGIPILLTKRPQLEPTLLDIAVEILSPVTETETSKYAFQQLQKQTRNQATQLIDEVTMSIVSRTSKTKVFSGNKSGLKCQVPTLFEMCIRILKENIDFLEFTGGVPFEILRPVVERTTYEQLIRLEDYNPYLMEDTHYLWEQHCKRRFRTKCREELESWREMYIRCLDEEREKFNSLTATIKLSKEPRTKPTYVDTNTKVTKNTIKSDLGTEASSHDRVNESKPQDSNQNRKRSKKFNDDPDWTPTTWYKTLYKKVRIPKPPKPPIKKTIDMLRYDRAKALEKKKRPR